MDVDHLRDALDEVEDFERDDGSAILLPSY